VAADQAAASIDAVRHPQELPLMRACNSLNHYSVFAISRLTLRL
jgi:hypothetical protein